MDGSALTEQAHLTAQRPDRDVPLRILAVGNLYPPQFAAGYELAWQRATRCAQTLGHRVRILTSDYIEDEGRPELDPDVHRTLRWYWDLEHYRFPRLSLAERMRLERHNCDELRRHLDEFKPHVVTWWSMGCMSLGLIEQVRRQGISAAFVAHDDWLIYGREHDQWMRTWQGPKRRLAGRVAERLCGLPTRVELDRWNGRWVFNSRYTLRRAREAGLKAPQVSVVYPGIEESFQETLDSQPWRWRLAYVGRIDRQKGVDTAVSALAELPAEATLSVWGTGDEQYVTEMKALADAIGVGPRVRFMGLAQGARLRSAYADTDVVVFPVRWDEPFGLVPLEAMGLGRLVVSTARGGTTEFLVDGTNALVFEADDADALAGCIRTLAGDPALRERLRAEGRQTASSFSADRFARDTVQEIIAAAAT